MDQCIFVYNECCMNVCYVDKYSIFIIYVYVDYYVILYQFLWIILDRKNSCLVYWYIGCWLFLKFVFLKIYRVFLDLYNLKQCYGLQYVILYIDQILKYIFVLKFFKQIS